MNYISGACLVLGISIAVSISCAKECIRSDLDIFLVTKDYVAYLAKCSISTKFKLVNNVFNFISFVFRSICYILLVPNCLLVKLLVYINKRRK